MDPYWTTINDILSGAESSASVPPAVRILAFASLCAIIGLMVVVVDLLVFFLRGRSILKLNHGRGTFVVALAWTVGAGVIGAIGQIADVLRSTALASLTVGIAWPTLFTQWLEDLARRQQEAEPEQFALPEEEV